MDEWISVKEKLPECQGWHLVCVYGWVTLAWFGSNGWEGFCTCTATSERVTHWKDLPEPPKEDDYG